MRRGDHRVRSLTATAGLLAASLMLTGCGLLSGPRSLSSDAPIDMQVSSPLVVDRGLLPAEFTCHAAGKPTSPPVFWTKPTPAPKSYVLIIDDADAPITPRVYWLVFDIAPGTSDVQVGQRPLGSRLARNSTGTAGYDPPCPAGSAHKYRITVYALNTVIGRALPGSPQLLPTWTTIAPHVIGRGTMTVTACPAPSVRTSTPVCQQKAKSGTGA